MNRSEQRVDAVAALARRGLVGEVSEDEHRRGKERLLMAVAVETVLPRSLGRIALGMAAAMVIAGAIVLFFVVGRGGNLEWRLDGGSVAEGGWMQAQGEPASLRFSDGTTVVLGAGARARLSEVTAVGARVVLEHGQLDVYVTPRQGADWTFDAGPYAVQVTGTSFAVSWSAAEDRFEVSVTSGSVMVRGPLAPEGVPVGKGQRLVAGGGSVRIDVTDAPAPAAPPPSAATLAPSAATTAIPVPAASPGWGKRVASGDFAGVVADAEARGVGTVLASASLDDLVALGDAARYAGRGDLARSALGAIRKRFASSAAAKSAAFLLGRMADDGGAPGEAIGWYERYLAEGGGPFAMEALGRKMVAEQRAGRADAARATAAVYVKRHPEGPHARAARELLGGAP